MNALRALSLRSSYNAAKNQNMPPTRQMTPTSLRNQDHPERRSITGSDNASEIEAGVTARYESGGLALGSNGTLICDLQLGHSTVAPAPFSSIEMFWPQRGQVNLIFFFKQKTAYEIWMGFFRKARCDASKNLRLFELASV